MHRVGHYSIQALSPEKATHIWSGWERAVTTGWQVRCFTKWQLVSALRLVSAKLPGLSAVPSEVGTGVH